MTSSHPMDVNTNTRIRWETLRRLPNLQKLKGKRILDVGCGLGYFSAQFAKAGADVVAIDLDEKALRFLHREFGITTHQLDITEAPFPDGIFDIIFIGEVLEHLVEPGRLVQKAEKSLAAGGTLVITVPALEGALIHTPGKSLGHDHGTEKHERDGFTADELIALTHECGLQLVSHSYCLFYLSELFMQLTKRAYLRKKPEYCSQSDITDSMRSLSYRSLKYIFPLLLLFFKIEEFIFRTIGGKGHCHTVVCQKP